MNFRFAIVSDPHIAVPETISHSLPRFHLCEVSISALERVFTHLEQLDLNFLLLPGDLTQDGEPENHQWLRSRLATLPFPAYVVPGNHDVPTLEATERTIGINEFPDYYRQFGYSNPQQLYYSCELVPGVQLIALNSNQFTPEGVLLGCLDDEQLAWLENLLPQLSGQLVLIVVHHNVIEHLPGQAHHELGRRYMLDNAAVLLKLLRQAHCQLIFTGHLHVQDVAYDRGVYEITTGSLVSYPHPYRIIELQSQANNTWTMDMRSYRVDSLPNWENLPMISRQWLGDRSSGFMMRLLTSPPLNLSISEAETLAPQLRHFWADVAAGDMLFDFPNFPPTVRRYFQQFGAIDREGNPALIDNQMVLQLTVNH